MTTKLNIEGTPIRVQEARRMLTNWNKLVKGETIKGVYRMKASDIEKVLEDFTITKGIVKHKTKAKGWSFNPETLEAKTGKVITKIPKYTPYKIIKPPKKEKMPKPAVKVRKVKKIPEMTKEDEAEEEFKEEPVKTEKKKRKPTAYAVFMGKQRKMGKSMSEIGALWKKQKK